MGINWDVVGGIGQGIVAGQRDQMAYRDAQFRQAQYKRMLEQQKVEDAVESQIRATPTTMEVEDRSGMDPSWQGPAQATRTVARPTADITLDAAKAMIASGRPELMARGMTMQTGVQQQRAAEQQFQATQMDLDRKRQLEELARSHAAETNAGMQAILQGKLTPAHFDEVFRYNTQQGAYANGNTVAPMSTPNGMVLAEYDRTGKLIGQTPMTAQYLAPLYRNARADRLRYELGQIDPTYLYKNEDVDYRRGEIGVKNRVAATGEREAGVKEGVLGIAQQKAPWEIREIQSKSGYYDALAEAAGAKADDYISKLQPGQQQTIKFLEQSALSAQKAAQENPTPATITAANAAKFKYHGYMKDIGIPGAADPYMMSGLPTPEAAAADIKASKKKPQEIEVGLRNAEALYGPAYADAIRQSLYGGVNDNISADDLKQMKALEAAGKKFTAVRDKNGKMQIKVLDESGAAPATDTPSAAAPSGMGISKGSPAAQAARARIEAIKNDPVRIAREQKREQEQEAARVAREQEREATTQRLLNAGW